MVQTHIFVRIHRAEHAQEVGVMLTKLLGKWSRGWILIDKCTPRGLLMLEATALWSVSRYRKLFMEAKDNQEFAWWQWNQGREMEPDVLEVWETELAASWGVALRSPGLSASRPVRWPPRTPHTGCFLVNSANKGFSFFWHPARTWWDFQAAPLPLAKETSCHLQQLLQAADLIYTGLTLSHSQGNPISTLTVPWRDNKEQERKETTRRQ